MSADELLQELRRLLTEAPYGGKRPLALALDFRGRWALHSLRSIANGRGWLCQAVHERLCDRIARLRRGELYLRPTGFEGAGKRIYTVESGPPALFAGTAKVPAR